MAIWLSPSHAPTSQVLVGGPCRRGFPRLNTFWLLVAVREVQLKRAPQVVVVVAR